MRPSWVLNEVTSVLRGGPGEGREATGREDTAPAPPERLLKGRGTGRRALPKEPAWVSPVTPGSGFGPPDLGEERSRSPPSRSCYRDPGNAQQLRTNLG